MQPTSSSASTLDGGRAGDRKTSTGSAGMSHVSVILDAHSSYVNFLHDCLLWLVNSSSFLSCYCHYLWLLLLFNYYNHCYYYYFRQAHKITRTHPRTHMSTLSLVPHQIIVIMQARRWRHQWKFHCQIPRTFCRTAPLASTCPARRRVCYFLLLSHTQTHKYLLRLENKHLNFFTLAYTHTNTQSHKRTNSQA